MTRHHALFARTQTYSYTPIGNFISKAGITQYYSGTQPHAVSALLNGATFEYDANGNMTQRVELSGTEWITYTQGWDIDNRLIVVTNTVSGAVTRYHYDADGQRVIRDNPDGTQVVYVHDYLEQNWDGIGVVTSYFSFGGQRVAMRHGSAVHWLHGDHLGSASLTTNITGLIVSEMRYYPFGETRWVSGTIPTDKLFTGQRELGGLGLYDYNARMYSPSLGRFISADTIVPRAGDPQALNRYAYARNSPMMRVDPTGQSDGCNPALYACGANGDLNRVNHVPHGYWTQIRESRLWTTRYHGFIVDRSHVRVDVAADILTQVASKVGTGGAVMGRGMSQAFGFLNFGEFVVEYNINDDLTEDQVIGVALAIYEDYQYRWESNYQGTILGFHDSVFSPEDLPSDYLGFVIAATGKSLEEIVANDLGGIIAIDQDSIPRVGLLGLRQQNFQFSPQTPDAVNHAWTGSLVIAPLTVNWTYVRHTPICPVIGKCGSGPIPR